MYRNTYFIALFVIILLCSDVASGATPLADLPQERVNYGRNWRDAYRVEPVNGVAEVSLGPASARQMLRLGLLPPKGGKHAVSVEVRSGDTLLYSIDMPKDHAWQRSRRGLDGMEDGAECILRIHTPEPVWIGPCELLERGRKGGKVILYLIDTLRLDHMSVYGYARDTTPRLRAFADDAVTFTHLTPQSSWTRPSVASLLTGVYPERHGARDNPDVMRSDLPSLAAALMAGGYESHVIMSNGNCLPRWGLGEDFYNYEFVHSKLKDVGVVDAALTAMQFGTEKPGFYYVHCMGPHNPYWPVEQEYFERFQSMVPWPEREAFRAKVEATAGHQILHDVRLLLGFNLRAPNPGAPMSQLATPEALKQLCKDLYDGEIAYSDAQFGRMIDTLKSRGEYDDALIIVTSDHGEEFWEHGGVYHGRTLYEEQLRIPLLVKLPGNAHGGAVREGIVNMVDVAPTLLDLLHLPEEPRFQGRSFAELLTTGKGDGRLAHASLMSVKFARDERTAKNTDWKRFEDINAEATFYYDLVQDPGEQHPRKDAPEALQDALGAELRRRAAATTGGLNFLITGRLSAAPEITGRITAPGLKHARLHFPKELGALHRDGDTVAFRLRFEKLEDRAAFEQDDQALIVLDVPADAEIHFEAAREGQPMDAAAFHLGPDWAAPAGLDRLRPEAVLSAPEGPARAKLPKGFHVYTWYVPPVTQVDAASLDPELRENLRALGYLE